MEFSEIQSKEKTKSQTKTKTVSSSQFIALTFVIGLGLNMLNLPALLVMDGGRDGWLAMLIITFADCLLLYLTVTAMQKLRASHSSKAYRVIKAVLGVVMSIWAAAKMLLLIGEARMFFGKTVFDNLDWLVFLGLLCAISAVLGAGGGRDLGRLAQLFVPIAIVTVIVIVMTGFAGDTDLSDIMPIFYNNAAVLKVPFKYALWVGNYPILFVFFGKVEFKKHTKLWCVSAAAVSGLAAAALTLTLSAAYGSMPQLIYYGNNAADMNQFVGSYNFGRIDLIIFTVWSIVLFLEMGLFHYGCVEGITAVVGKEHPWLYSWIAAAVLYILLNFLVPCDVRLFNFATVYSSVAASVIQIAVPVLGGIICLIISVFGKKGEKAVYVEK